MWWDWVMERFGMKKQVMRLALALDASLNLGRSQLRHGLES